MPAISELNSSPYWDDYSPETKDFLRVLFRPGYAVQARELNQLQSILQTQVERFGNHIFKEGSIVVGGMTTINVKTRKYIKIQDNYNGDEVIISSFLNKKITGGTTGAQALVVAVAEKEGSDPKTLIVEPLNGTDFDEYGETINAEGGGSCLAAASGTISGESSTASIDNGIFYTKGFFVICPQQTTYLEKYTRLANAKAGLLSEITFIDEGDDESLLDNATGSYNYAAPGAHRLKINLTFASKSLDFTEDADKFIDLLEVREGQLYKQVTRPIYSEIEKTLARRTFDESGDYTVKPFLLDVQNHPSDTNKLRAYIEPGKAYVKGYEFETIARQYLDLDKPRSNSDDQTQNGLDIGMNYGNYVIVTVDEGYPDISSLETLYFYNAAGSQIGTCRVSSIQYDSTVSAVPRYRLYLFAIYLTAGAGFTDVRSLRSSNGTTKKFDLVAPASGSTGVLYGTDTASYVFETGLQTIRTFRLEDPLNPGTFTVSTDTDYQYKGVYTQASTNSFSWTVGTNETLQTGTDTTTKETHYLVVDTLSGEQITNFTLSLSNVNRTGTINLGATGPTNVAVVYTVNSNSTTPRVKTLVNPKTNTGYARIGPNTPTTIRLASTANTSTTDYYKDGLIKIIAGTGVMSGATGFLITAYDETTQIATISGATGFLAIPDASSYYEIAPPTSSYTYNTDSLASGRKYFSTAIVTDNILSLTVPDGLRIHKILNSTSQSDWFDPTKDVTNKFIFDNGQRDFTYEYSTLSLAPGQTVTGAISVFFEYFTHTGSGYFNVDSYPSYDLIPSFTSSKGKTFDLRNCVDFRPVRNSSAASIGSGPYESTVLPISGSNMNADVTFWLPRIDKIVATTDRSFKVLKGNANLNPKEPDDLDNGMTLYRIKYNPYTFNNKDIELNYIDNKRYTMRDIGRIEKRIEKIEYYSLLNMLERETASLDVTDANGNDRFKNGFVVDTFTGHGVGDVTNLDYRCSIDERSQEARPRFYNKNYDLFLKTSESSGYTLRGSLLSRSFTTSNFIEQPFASQAVNVNPYAVFSWRGTMTISPSVDFWKDERIRPENIINMNGNNDNIQTGIDFSGSRWNSWETNFNGETEDAEDLFMISQLGAGRPAATVNLDPRNGMFDISDWRYEEVNVPSGTGNVGPDNTRRAQWRNWRNGVTATAEIGGIVPAAPFPARTTTGTRVQNQQQLNTRTNTVRFADRVVDVSSSQWMRSKTISFSATGLKPGTVLYPFFDDVLISRYVTWTSGNITNASGSISGTFTIPDATFLVGDRILRLSDNSENNKALETTFAQARYTANGILLHKQTESINIRTPEPQIPVPQDPLAQTFFVDPTIFPNGLFLDSVDVFFKTKDSSIPVTVQIRSTVNGYPSSTTILPFAEKTLTPASVNVSATASTATNFQFPSIVYLEPGEYSIVILANSQNYEAWIAEIGQKKVDSNDLITQQPYVGSLFKSQNSSTWTAEQTQDLKFNLKRCSFTEGSFTAVLTDYAQTRTKTASGSSGSYIITVNNTVDLSVGQSVSGTGIGSSAEILYIDGFNITLTVVNSGTVSGNVTFTVQTRTKTASGSSGSYIITVNNTDDLSVGQSVSGTGIGSSAEILYINGFNITLTVVNSGTVSGNVTFTGKTSGDGYADVIWVGLSTIEFPNTTVTSSFISKPDGSSLDSSYTTFLTNKNYEFSGRREIVANAESFKHRVVGNVTSNHVSPVIDMEKNNFITIQNDINNITETTTTTTGATGFNSTVIGVNSTQYIQNGSLIKIDSEYMYVTSGGGYSGATGITVQRGALGSGYAIGGATGTLVGATSIGSGATVYSLSETFPTGGVAASKYITRPVVLQSPADYLKVYLTAVRLPGTDIKVYYKIKAAEDTDILSNKSWIEMQKEYPGDNSYSLDNLDFKEYIFRPDSDAYPANISYGAQNGWVVYKSFNQFAIKIVFLSSDTTVIPKIADFRAIALDRLI